MPKVLTKRLFVFLFSLRGFVLWRCLRRVLQRPNSPQTPLHSGCVTDKTRRVGTQIVWIKNSSCWPWHKFVTETWENEFYKKSFFCKKKKDTPSSKKFTAPLRFWTLFRMLVGQCEARATTLAEKTVQQLPMQLLWKMKLTVVTGQKEKNHPQSQKHISHHAICILRENTCEKKITVRIFLKLFNCEIRVPLNEYEFKSNYFAAPRFIVT